MEKNFNTKFSGQIGENLVVAELGRRNIIATAFAGNVPDIDIVAYKEGKSIPLQVKALKTGSLRTVANKYLNIELIGNKQIIKGKNRSVNRNLIFVIVKIGKKIGEDKFYICEQGLLQDIVLRNHKSFLDKHNGVRPRNPKSYDCSIELSSLSKTENMWELIEKKLGV